MQLNKVDFRDLDNKWIALAREKDIKKIYKKLKLKYDGGLVLAYSFLTHEKGIQFRIAGCITKEENSLCLENEFIEKKIIFPYKKDLKYQFSFVEKKVSAKIKGTKKIEEEIHKQQEKPSILEARKITEIDAFRHEEYVDDVELLYKGKKKDEYLWARIEDCSKKNLLFVCSLLENSTQNKNYKEGTLVLAKITKEKKNSNLVIDGIVDKVKKE